MKNILFFIGLSISSCTVHNTTPVQPAASGFDVSKATLLKTGMFVGLDGPTTGTATIYDQGGTKYIVLDPFVSHSGPDLKVYLSKDSNAKEYIRVGKLQATTGKQSYVVPGTPAVSDYNFIHIWCEAYSVNFAQAAIK